MADDRRATERPRAGIPGSLYGYIWRVSGREQVWLALLSAAIFPLTMVPLELQRRIINQAIGRRDLQLLGMLCLAYLAVLVLRGGLKYALGVYRNTVGERATRNLRRRIYCASAAEPAALGASPRRDAADEGTTLSMVVAEVEPLGSFVGESITVPLMQAGILVSVLGYMLWIEPWIAAIGFALCLPQLYLVPRLQAAINRHAAHRIELLRELGQALVDPTGRSDAGTAPIARNEERIFEVYRTRLRIFRLKHLLKFLNNLLHNAGPFSVLLLGGWLVIEGRADLGTLVAFMSGFDRIADPWRELIAFYRRASNARVRYGLVAASLGAPA